MRAVLEGIDTGDENDLSTLQNIFEGEGNLMKRNNFTSSVYMKLGSRSINLFILIDISNLVFPSF